MTNLDHLNSRPLSDDESGESLTRRTPGRSMRRRAVVDGGSDGIPAWQKA
ncbi:hypothetical protein ABZ454_24250 [Streptomyces sp. NPDC005803]